METKRVGIWIRVSTDSQVEDESPEVHEQRARYYCQAKGWTVVEIYRLDGMSGKSVMHYPETQRMLNDINSGHITGLVFSKLARLARNTRQLLEFAEIFRSKDADLVSLAEQIDTSTPAGRLFFTMVAALTEWEREEISSRVAASVPIRAEMGRPLGGQASFGYKWDNKQLVIDDREAPVRKLIYEIFIECQRKKTTAARLNALGHRTRNGTRFSDTTVDRLLRDTTAKGIRTANYTKSTGDGKHWTMKPKEEWIQIPCPAIINEQLWQECNAILDEQRQKRSKKGRRSEYLLAGLVKCTCGKSMYVFSTAKKYTCKTCKNSISESVMNEIYQENLKQYLGGISPQLFLEEIDRDILEQENLLVLAIRKRTELRKQMNALVDLRLSGELSKEHMAERYKPCEKQVQQLDKSIPELQAKIDYRKIQRNSSDYVLNEAKALYTQWNDMQFPQRRAIAETVTENITIGQDTINIALAYLPGSEQTSQRNVRDSSPLRA